MDYSRSSFPLARVRSDALQTTEDLERWVTLNAICLAEFTLLCAVDLSQLDRLLLQRSSGLFVLRREGLAVTTPGSEDCVEY